MLLKGYNILRPDRRRDIPHSREESLQEEPTTITEVMSQSVRHRTGEKLGERTHSYFATENSPRLCFGVLHGTVGNPQLGQAGKAPLAFILPCPLAPASQGPGCRDQRHLLLLLLCKISLFTAATTDKPRI